ncbi:MAG: 50S ribosomal protein L11 methyltransferase [Proteobacteria bacterium]|nr:50S ribosomal protein L11 methyltransferase [Pseudomonadota bacterium]
MSRATACVLVLDGWAAAEATLASIRGLGLAMAVGLIGEERGKRPGDVEVLTIDWRDDFADARNQLADRLTADWLLWLNDDEDLIAFAEPELEGPRAGVWIEHGAEWTPRMAVRLQRRRSDVRWSGALHETLIADGEGAVGMADGILLRVARERTRARLDVHHAMAARGQGGYGFALAEARHAQAMELRGRDFMLWLRAYKLACEPPILPEYPDPRVEPAIRLCAYDYIEPALKLAEENPGIVGLDYAILRSNLSTKRQRMDDRVKELVRRLVEGRIDRRYSIRLGLEGDRPRLVRYALHACLIGDFDRDVSKYKPGETVHAGRYEIIPASSQAARAGRFRILMDPGMIFGTGKHPATRGAIIAIDRLARRRNFRRVLDFGCGSGILAIAAAKAWPARVSAYDINPVAVEQARRNIRANRLGGRVRARKTHGLKDARLPRGETYDLEVFNLDAKHVTRYGAALRRRLAPGGVIVITGFANNEERRVISLFNALGLRMLTVFRNQNWSTMILEAPKPIKRRAGRPRVRYRRARH